MNLNMIIDALRNPKGFFVATPISILCAAFAALFFVLVIIYSIKHMKGRAGLWRYYLYTVLTFISSLGVLFANNFMVLLVFWGFLGLLLYLLITFGRRDGTPAAARKALVIVGLYLMLMVLLHGLLLALLEL